MGKGERILEKVSFFQDWGMLNISNMIFCFGIYFLKVLGKKYMVLEMNYQFDDDLGVEIFNWN